MSRPVDEERQQELRHRNAPSPGSDDLSKVESKSPGVRRMEAINDVWTRTNKIWFIVALVILTCTSPGCDMADGQTRDPLRRP